MTDKCGIYQCEICGNIVEVLHAAAGTLVCCGEDMNLLEEKTADTSTEKHVPYVEKKGNVYTVKVGQNQEHPMTDEHRIEWIQVIAGGSAYRKFLKPGDKPQAEFEVNADIKMAREYCNVHGLWKS